MPHSLVVLLPRWSPSCPPGGGQTAQVKTAAADRASTSSSPSEILLNTSRIASYGTRQPGGSSRGPRPHTVAMTGGVTRPELGSAIAAAASAAAQLARDESSL